MFLVFSRERISTYIVSVVTVVLLFVIANMVTENNSVETISYSNKLVPIYNVQTDEKKIAFTMNCAWNADDIDLILNVLERNDVKITFFLVGDWIDKYPEAAKKIYEAGHELASHSDTHPHVNNLTYDENISEIEKSNDKIEEITGKRTNIYRAPYGEYNDTVIKAANDSGYYTIQWSLDTLDYTGLTGEEMWKRLDGNLENGDIILSHNGTKYTAESLDMLIKNILNQGFEIVPISKLIYFEEYSINANGTQIKNNV